MVGTSASIPGTCVSRYGMASSRAPPGSPPPRPEVLPQAKRPARRSPRRARVVRAGRGLLASRERSKTSRRGAGRAAGRPGGIPRPTPPGSRRAAELELLRLAEDPRRVDDDLGWLQKRAAVAYAASIRSAAASSREGRPRQEMREDESSRPPPGRRGASGRPRRRPSASSSTDCRRASGRRAGRRRRRGRNRHGQTPGQARPPRRDLPVRRPFPRGARDFMLAARQERSQRT